MTNEGIARAAQAIAPRVALSFQEEVYMILCKKDLNSREYFHVRLNAK
jgi:hypothetical protein